VSSCTSVQCNITRTQSGTQALCAEAVVEEVRKPRAVGLMMSVEAFRSSEGSVPKRHLPELSLLGVESILVLVMRTVTNKGSPPFPPPPPPGNPFLFLPNQYTCIILGHHQHTLFILSLPHYIPLIIVTTFRCKEVSSL
jgi:hypothetical protein